MDPFYNVIDRFFWISILLTHMIAISIVWRYSNRKKIYRILLGLLLAWFISIIIYVIFMQIAIRHGIGPS